MTEKATFDLAIVRARHFLEMYDLVKNTRTRAIRSDWSRKFKKFMGWKQSEKIMRIDGKSSVLILRSPQTGFTYERFEHDFASELLRAALVASISALDRYMHDAAVSRSWRLLNGSESRIPKKLKKLHIPALVTAKALKALRTDANSRPGNQVKKAIQDVMHHSTYQGSAGIDQCMQLIGVNNFWTQVCALMPANLASQDLQDQLNQLVKRRNQIVHEADLQRKIRSKKDTLRPIKRKYARDAVEFVEQFVAAVDRVI